MPPEIVKTIFRAQAYGESRTFDTAEEAEAWIEEKEAEMEVENV